MTRTEYREYVQHLVAQMQRDSSYQAYVMLNNE